MSSLESSKSLAGIGAILLFLSFIPIIGIIGIILLFIGMKGLADHYKEPGIYQNALWGVVFGIIALVALTAGFISLIFGGIFTAATFGFAGIDLTIIGVIVTLLLVFVFYVIAAMYFKKAFSLLAQKTGEHSLETAGNLLWIGALLTIVFGLGLILIFIAWIFATIGFFAIKGTPQSYTYTPSPPIAISTPTTTQTTRYCPNCGAPVQSNNTFCPNCGKQLPQ